MPLCSWFCFTSYIYGVRNNATWKIFPLEKKERKFAPRKNAPQKIATEKNATGENCPQRKSPSDQKKFSPLQKLTRPGSTFNNDQHLS